VQNAEPDHRQQLQKLRHAFTMEGTTAEAAGASNGYAVASLVLGIIGLPTCVIGSSPASADLRTHRAGANEQGQRTGGRGLAIAGIATSGVGVALFVANFTGLLR